ncbi:MAG: MurR/RpiR family transcriptional regulator [Bilifractor sp.]
MHKEEESFSFSAQTQENTRQDPLQTDNLSTRISRHYPRMSKGQKRLADYVMDHYEKAAFMTAAELGRQARVSESTTVRFATLLGYQGFPEFHQTLEELVRNRLNSIQRMEVTYERIPQEKILDTVLTSDIEKIKLTQEHMDRKAFHQAIETILTAKSIYVMGLRSCAPLAAFLAFYLNEIFDNVHLVNSTGSSEVFEQLVRIGEGDVIIGISFPRYSMRTLKAMEFANNRNAKVITLTDSIHSPMNLYSSCNLIARSDMASIVDSLVAPLSVINALIVALSMRRQSAVINTMKTLEQIWNEYQVYSRDEINPIEDNRELRLKDPDKNTLDS